MQKLGQEREERQMYQCTLEKEGFLGTFYESETPTEKAIIFVGGSGENRENVEQRAQALCKEGFHVLALGYYLWKPLSPHTVGIPIDYAERAIAFLKNYDAVSIRKIGMTCHGRRTRKKAKPTSAQ